jgi:hypothetical protein
MVWERPSVRQAGAFEAYAELAGSFDAYVLSAWPWENPTVWSDRLFLVKEHRGAASRR